MRRIGGLHTYIEDITGCVLGDSIRSFMQLSGGGRALVWWWWWGGEVVSVSEVCRLRVIEQSMYTYIHGSRSTGRVE